MDQNNAAALMALLQVKERLDDKFIRELIMHLCLNVPSFDGQSFLDGLHLIQANLPSPGKRDPHSPKGPKSLEEIGLEYWRRKVEMVEKALQGAERVRSKGG